MNLDVLVYFKPSKFRIFIQRSMSWESVAYMTPPFHNGEVRFPMHIVILTNFAVRLCVEGFKSHPIRISSISCEFWDFEISIWDLQYSKKLQTHTVVSGADTGISLINLINNENKTWEKLLMLLSKLSRRDKCKESLMSCWY